MADKRPEQLTQVLLITNVSMGFLSINLIFLKTWYVYDGDVRIWSYFWLSSKQQFTA